MKSILLVATALALLCGPALAQTSNSSSNSGAKATANTKSASRAAAVGNTTNITVQGNAGGDSSGNSGGSTGTPATAGTSGGSLEYGGSYTVRNTPEVIAPSVVGGNPCAVGASGGMALPGFGLALGATWADKACERRQIAALMFNMGDKSVAYEVMCQDEMTRAAMKTAGKPCAADTPVAALPTPAIAAAAPAQAIAPVAASVPAKPVRPEWCFTASKAELRGRADCDVRS